MVALDVEPTTDTVMFTARMDHAAADVVEAPTTVPAMVAVPVAAGAAGALAVFDGAVGVAACRLEHAARRTKERTNTMRGPTLMTSPNRVAFTAAVLHDDGKRRTRNPRAAA
jgi:hypothetical protein